MCYFDMYMNQTIFTRSFANTGTLAVFLLRWSCWGKGCSCSSSQQLELGCWKNTFGFIAYCLSCLWFCTWTIADGFWGPVRTSYAPCKCVLRYLALEGAAAHRHVLLLLLLLLSRLQWICSVPVAGSATSQGGNEQLTSGNKVFSYESHIVLCL